MTVASNLNPSTFGQPVTFTATVTTPPGALANGQINWSIGSVVVQQNNLAVAGSTGTATFATNALNVGTFPITASYVSFNPARS